MYWISLLKDTDYIDLTSYESLFKDAEELNKILFSILKKDKN